MKKIALLLAFVLVFSIPLTAHAATPRIISILPELSFDGYTANCYVSIFGNGDSEEIDATIKLWREDTCIKTWFASGVGYVYWDTTTYISKGHTYTLTVDATIGGVEMSRVSASGQS